MNTTMRFAVSPTWRTILTDLGLNVAEVLRRADLPADLFSRTNAGLSTEAYFRLWRAIEFMVDDMAFSLHILRGLSSEAFSPPLFAAYCSPDLNTALQRLRQFKPLICPMTLDLDIGKNTSRVTLRFLESRPDIPPSLITLEVGFFVQLARMATRETVIPLSVTAPTPLPAQDACIDYFGVTPTLEDAITVTFRADDAAKPFITENSEMWAFFEPGLRKRLSEINTDSGMAERVRSALLELLPVGKSSVDDLACQLHVSRRTLQRRLSSEGTSVKTVLGQVREELARYYITQSDLPYAQISFLLGYEDPNSFFRAFHAWTGDTPESVRSRAMH